VILESTHEIAKQVYLDINGLIINCLQIYVQLLKRIQKLWIRCTLMGRHESDTITECGLLLSLSMVVISCVNRHYCDNAESGRIYVKKMVINCCVEYDGWIVDESDRLFETILRIGL
jgi:hypothetical protein